MYEPGEMGGSRSQFPLNDLRKRLQEFPTDQNIVVHGSSEYRSSIAVSLLPRFFRIKVLIGGFGAWNHILIESLPTTSETIATPHAYELKKNWNPSRRRTGSRH